MVYSFVYVIRSEILLKWPESTELRYVEEYSHNVRVPPLLHLNLDKSNTNFGIRSRYLRYWFIEVVILFIYTLLFPGDPLHDDRYPHG
jgi:hypothetical protein